MVEILTDKKIDFIKPRAMFAVFSGVVVAIAAALIVILGFKFGVEFTGGTQITASFDHEVGIGELRKLLDEKGLDAKPTTLETDDDKSTFLIRVGQYYAGDEDLGAAMRSALVAKFGEDALRYWAFDPELGDRAQARIETEDGTEITADDVRGALAGLENIDKVEKDRAGTINIRLRSLARDVVSELEAAFDADDNSFSIEAIGPGVAADLKIKGILSILVACLLILGYIWFRFDLDFAPGAVVALVHDATIVAGCFALLGLEFNVTTVAALLAIIGYSVNDTVVVYDRIRENLELHGDSDVAGIVNRSINETLSRTLLTSTTTLLSTLSITLFGGAILRDFGLALTIGVVVGTYSSIFVAASMMLFLHGKRHPQHAAPARA
jgi:preprotein translocase subunit SecF